MEIFIRKVVAADIVFVKNLEEECGLASWSVEDYAQEIMRNDSVFLIAEDYKKSIGFIVTRLIMNQKCIYLNSRDTTSENFNITPEIKYEAEIYNLAVLKKHRRKNCATQLIETLVSSIGSNLSKIYLEVRASNLSAIGFYQKNGFSETGRRKNFYRQPTEDAILMCRNLGWE